MEITAVDWFVWYFNGGYSLKNQIVPSWFGCSMGTRTAILRPLSGNQSSGRRWMGHSISHRFHEGYKNAHGSFGKERVGSSIYSLVMGGVFAITRKDLIVPYEEGNQGLNHWYCIFLMQIMPCFVNCHAGFGFAVEKMLIDHWQSIGVDADVTFITQIGYELIFILF